MDTCLNRACLHAVVFGVATTGTALAGGLTDPAPMAAPVPPMAVPAGEPVWTGAYGGLLLGAAFSDGRAERTNAAGAVIELDVSNGLFPAEIDDTDRGLLGGVTLGYNLQRNGFVAGLEFDLSASGLETEPEFSRVDPGPLFPGVITDTTYRTEISNLATLRLRGGFASGRTLFYGTAGVAAGQVENEFTLSLPNFPGLPDGYNSPDWRENETRYGFVVGAGIEQRLTDRISLKGEAIYYDLNDVEVEGRDPANFPGQEIDYTFDNDGYALRIGINVAF